MKFGFSLVVSVLLAKCTGTTSAATTNNSQSTAHECSQPDYQCSNGRCLNASAVCNGVNDCGDGGDESGLACSTSKCDPPLQFRCQFSLVCLPVRKLCDGYPDCGDNDLSDEMAPLCAPKPKPCNTTEFRCANSNCIKNSLVCNKVDDCGDNSDEYGCVSQGNCKVENGGCEQLCTDVSKNVINCHCKPGFRPLKMNGTRCEDIDECATFNNTCSQTCINTVGSYECACNDYAFLDYITIGNMSGRDCRAFGLSPELLIGRQDRAEVVPTYSERLFMFTGRKIDANGTIGPIMAVDINFMENSIYWIDGRTTQLWRAETLLGNESSKAVKIPLNLITHELPVSLAADWMGGNIYIGIASDDVHRNLNSTSGRVSVMTHDARYVKTLIRDIQLPCDIAVDFELGLLFWTECGNHPKIQVSDMAGHNRRPLVTDLASIATSLTIDHYKDHRLYYTIPLVGKIESILPDGTGRVTVVEEKSLQPYRLDVFERWIYWASQASPDIYIQDKLGLQQKRLQIRGKGNVQALRVYHPAKHNVPTDLSKNPCKGVFCSHFCLLLPKGKIECACADYQDPGGVPCRPGTKAP